MAEDKMTFAAIVLVAIVAIVGMIGFMGLGKGITGLASTQDGTLSINFAGTADISLTQATCNFGSGYVNPSFTSATLNCDGTMTNWVNTTAFAPALMTLENNGSTLVNVTVVSNASASSFIGAGATQQFKGVATETSACSGTLTGSNTALTTTDALICTQMEYTSGTDEFNITYQVTIPVNVTQGAKTSKITFTGTSL